MRQPLANRLRSTLQVAAWSVSLSASLLVLTPAAAQGTKPPAPALPDSVLVVVQISTIDGVDPARAAESHARIKAVIEKQPGLLDSGLYSNYNPQAKPTWVHVTHWTQFSDWEKLFTSQEFLKASQDVASHVKIETGAFKLER